MELCRMRLLRLWRQPQPPTPTPPGLTPLPLDWRVQRNSLPHSIFWQNCSNVPFSAHYENCNECSRRKEGEGGRKVMGAPSLPQRPGNITSRPACSVLDDKASRANGSNLIKHLPVFYNSIAPKSTYWGIHTFSMKSILPPPYKT